MGAAIIRKLIGRLFGFAKRERELQEQVNDLRDRNERLLRTEFMDTALPIGEMRLSGEWKTLLPADVRLGAVTLVWRAHSERIH